MNKQDVIDFFNEQAAHWDADMIRNDQIIATILDNAKVCEGTEVLDVACGTGVLFPDYLKRNVKSITGIDISPEMIQKTREKFGQEHITLICGDAEHTTFDHLFDCCMVYNAFPHFPNPEQLIQTLSKTLKPGGRLSIAHGMSRERIDGHHKGAASKVSVGLMSETELAKLFEPYFEVDIIISNEEMYQVCGIKK